MDRLGDGVEAIEGVVRDSEVEGRKERSLSGYHAIGRKKAECLDVGGGVGNQVVHAFVKTSMCGGFD